jgi:outer membrane protein
MAYSATSLDLDQSFQAAVRLSETVSDQSQQILQADERISQTRGNLFPTVSGSASYLIQQAPSDPVAQSFFPTSQPNIKVSASQPLFRGLREFAALRQANRLAEAQGHNKGMVLMQLYNDVAQNFFMLLGYDQEMTNLKTQLKLYQDRIDELKLRTRTGQSSASDALTAEASQAVVQAQLKQINRDYKATWEVFSFLTGFSSDIQLTYKLDISKEDRPLDFYTKRLDERPDIKAAIEKVEAAEEGVSIAKGAHLPSADLLGNYYFLRPSGVFSEIRWDLQATLTIPIFSGGIIQSQVHQATSQRIQADLALSRVRRVAEQEVKTLFENYHSDLEQLTALERSMELNEKNYHILKRDYSRGLTRNLDVLQALTQFQESKRALDRTRWSAQATWTRLQILSAVRSLSELRK